MLVELGETMAFTWITAVGLIAALFTTTSFLPQVVKTWRTKSAGDLSLVMYAVLSAGVLLWAVYGLLIGDLPIVVANLVTLSLAGSILFFILRDKNRPVVDSEASHQDEALEVSS